MNSLMSRHRVTGLGGLVFLGIVVGLPYLPLSSGSHESVAQTQATVPEALARAILAGVERTPAQTGAQSSLVRCMPVSGHTQPIEIREEPSTKSTSIASVVGNASELVRLDARTVKGHRDWIRVRNDGRVGWVDGATIICRLTPAQAAAAIAGEADEVLRALKARNMRELSNHVHPVKGVRFSPYVDVDAKRSVVLTAGELPAALQNARQRRWGSEDGSGEPIIRSFADYYKRFIYDRDFAGTMKRFNEFGGRSTTRPNIWEVYPNAIVVEAHVPGTKPESEGMDWASLLLVFEQHDSHWYLSALVHDQWTI